MNECEKALTNRTIIKAEVNGYGIRLTLDNGRVFDFDASDGGYSLYGFIEELLKEETDEVQDDR